MKRFTQGLKILFPRLSLYLHSTQIKIRELITFTRFLGMEVILLTKNQIDYWNLQELRRSNAAKEAETHRANVTQETETARSNLARETETHRSNTTNEGIAFGNLSETERSHRANEDIGVGNLEETIRHQQTSEIETNRANLAKETENYRHNSAVESETHRSNVVDETMRGVMDAAELGFRAAEIGIAEQKLGNDVLIATIRAGGEAGTNVEIVNNMPTSTPVKNTRPEGFHGYGTSEPGTLGGGNLGNGKKSDSKKRSK